MLSDVKRLPVDLAELAALFDQPRKGPVRSFLDRATGEIEAMPRDAEVEGVFDDILAAPERWVEIQPLPLAERQALRRRFVEERMGDPHLRLRLADALAAERPFLAFEAVLRDARRIDEWLAFRAEALAVVAAAWLSAIKVEARLPGGVPS
jgi:hypothetical protein